MLTYDDTPLGPPMRAEEDDPVYELLDALHDDHVYNQGTCRICEELVTRIGWAEFSGWECEVTCLLPHCDVCGVCGRNGQVCRRCGVCVEHEESGGVACWSTRWRKARRRAVEFYAHDLWNTETKRWG